MPARKDTLARRKRSGLRANSTSTMVAMEGRKEPRSIQRRERKTFTSPEYPLQAKKLCRFSLSLCCSRVMPRDCSLLLGQQDGFRISLTQILPLVLSTPRLRTAVARRPYEFRNARCQNETRAFNWNARGPMVVDVI